MHARARARAGYSTVSVRGNIAQNLLSPSADLPSVRLPRGRPTKTFFVSAKQKTSFGQSLFFSRRRRVRRASDASFILSAAPPSYAFRAVERRGRGVKKKRRAECRRPRRRSRGDGSSMPVTTLRCIRRYGGQVARTSVAIVRRRCFRPPPLRKRSRRRRRRRERGLRRHSLARGTAMRRMMPPRRRSDTSVPIDDTS